MTNSSMIVIAVIGGLFLGFIVYTLANPHKDDSPCKNGMCSMDDMKDKREIPVDGKCSPGKTVASQLSGGLICV